jgi:hypothetical protein
MAKLGMGSLNTAIIGIVLLVILFKLYAAPALRCTLRAAESFPRHRQREMNSTQDTC